jgi:hypothetical protein
LGAIKPKGLNRIAKIPEGGEAKFNNNKTRF